MANVNTYIRKAEFIFKEDITICNLHIEFVPDEWPAGMGTGWRTKSFPASQNVVDFINTEVPNYLDWPFGRVE